MKRIFENDLPKQVKAFDAGDMLSVIITTRPSSHWLRENSYRPFVVYTPKQAKRFTRLRRGLAGFFIVSALLAVVAVYIQTDGAQDMTLLAAFVSAAVLAVFLRLAKKVFLDFGHIFGSKTFETKIEFHRDSMKIEYVAPKLYVRSDHDELHLRSYDSSGDVFGSSGSASVPMQDNSIFASVEKYNGKKLEYRYGIRQSNVGFFFVLSYDGFTSHHGEMVGGVLNEIIRMIHETPITPTEQAKKSKPKSKRAKAKKPEPIIEDDAPFNPMD